MTKYKEHKLATCIVKIHWLYTVVIRPLIRYGSVKREERVLIRRSAYTKFTTLTMCWNDGMSAEGMNFCPTRYFYYTHCTMLGIQTSDQWSGTEDWWTYFDSIRVHFSRSGNLYDFGLYDFSTNPSRPEIGFRILTV